MIFPTQKDIGRSVVYVPQRGPREDGIITSFNEYAVFVQYKVGCTSQATSRQDLEWRQAESKARTLAEMYAMQDDLRHEEESS